MVRSPSGAERPNLRIPGGAALVAGIASIEKIWKAVRADDEPPMTKFLAEQMSTAHWFDQRRTHERFTGVDTRGVSIEEGLELLAAHYAP